MRTLEWLLCLSFVPIVLLPLSPPHWRRRWLLAAAPLPALVTALHLAVEGWRVQMLPLYTLAALVLAIHLPALFGRSRPPRRRRGILVSGAAGLALVLGGVLAGWALPVVELPPPGGPYAVGLVDRELVDAARGRRLMASVWYPAARPGAPAPLTRHPAEIAAGLSKLTGLPAPVFQHLRYVNLAASQGAPVLADGGPFPVLVFSHGMVGLRLQSSPVLQDLASRGYVVVAIDHTDAAAVTVFPDGEARFYDLGRMGMPAGVEPTTALMDEHVLPAWIADQRFVYDTIEDWAASDPLLAGRIDPGRIGSFGHSFGGATALEVCRVDPRCRAAANLDGGLYGGIAREPATRPLLLMTSAESNRYQEAIDGWAALIDNAQADAAWLELPGSNHLSFTITQLLSPILVPAGFDPRAGLATAGAYLGAFFDAHLRGIDSPLLHPQPGAADVRWRSP
ncbi:MAG TPA: hypothetical protein VD886_26440 [Herpetosiphonaceae bacterium]|nr:hypothetical protein [Herpetosiphonaceae bacterium]